MGKVVKRLSIRTDREFRGEQKQRKENRGQEKGPHSLWGSTTSEVAGRPEQLRKTREIQQPVLKTSICF